MKNIPEIITGVIILLCCAVAWGEIVGFTVHLQTDHLGPATFPKATIILTAVFSVMLIYQGLISKQKSTIQTYTYKSKMPIILTLFVLYIISIQTIHGVFLNIELEMLHTNITFLITTSLFLSLTFIVLKRKNIFEILSISIAVPVAIIIVFSYFFHIVLP